VRLSLSERLLFTKYLAVLLNSGLPIDEALDILVQQSSGSLKEILTTLKNAVRSGNTLASGLGSYPHIFSSVYVNLVSAGEASTIIAMMELNGFLTISDGIIYRKL